MLVFITLSLCGSFCTHTQNITGDGNVAIHGDSNHVNNKTSFLKDVQITTNQNDNSSIQEDLAKGNYKKILFTKKKPAAFSDNKKLLLLTATNNETEIIHQEAQKSGLNIEKKFIKNGSSIGKFKLYEIKRLSILVRLYTKDVCLCL